MMYIDISKYNVGNDEDDRKVIVRGTNTPKVDRQKRSTPPPYRNIIKG